MEVTGKVIPDMNANKFIATIHKFMFSICRTNFPRHTVTLHHGDEHANHISGSLLNFEKSPANNGEPFRFRIGSVKSAQLFQLSAENFFRLRYESVPLQ